MEVRGAIEIDRMTQLPNVAYFGADGQRVINEDKNGFKITYNSALRYIEIDNQS